MPTSRRRSIISTKRYHLPGEVLVLSSQERVTAGLCGEHAKYYYRRGSNGTEPADLSQALDTQQAENSSFSRHTIGNCPVLTVVGHPGMELLPLSAASYKFSNEAMYMPAVQGCLYCLASCLTLCSWSSSDRPLTLIPSRPTPQITLLSMACCPTCGRLPSRAGTCECPMLRAHLVHHRQLPMLQQKHLRRQQPTLQQKHLRSNQRPACKLLQARAMHTSAFPQASKTSSSTALTQSREGGSHAQDWQSPN